MLAMCENQRQHVHLFLLSQNQENLLLENERLAEETHANELRRMIGNVAHDLKTPLSAFVSGMDLINHIV
jgi:signal transduction histidine kinase